MIHRSRLHAPFFAAAMLAGCNAMFDIEEGTLVDGEAGDAGEGGTAGAGGNGGASGGNGGASGGNGGASGGNGGASGGNGGSGGSNGGSGASGGKGGSGGSDATGGNGASGGSDLSGGKGGSLSGGGGGGGVGGTAVPLGGAAGSAGSAVATAGGGPFACAEKVPTCTTISQFAEWGSGDFHGGASAFGGGITMDMSDRSVLHVTGMVTGWGHGFNLWFIWCTDLSAATGVTFTVRGTTSDVMPNWINFEVQTNSTFPWEPAPVNQKGACTAPVGTDPWSYCTAPRVRVPLQDAPRTVTWAEIMGGTPVPFDPVSSPSEVIGLQWQFPWSAEASAYAVDVTLDDVTLTGLAPVNCDPYSPPD